MAAASSSTDTIYALASGAPLLRAGAAVAVFRLSGSVTAEAVRRLIGREVANPFLVPRQATTCRLRHPETAEPIDRGLALWFPGPASVTGEDYAELQVHGGRAVIAGLLDALSAVPGCRLAQPGEFTRRSFQNGKLDLTAVEGIADLVAAETAAQRRQALRQLEGELGRLYDGWRTQLLRALAHLEAAIDFPDEDLPEDLAAQVLPGLVSLRAEILRHVADRRGERLRDGVCVAIIGPPNVGKSSLLNRLARREAAIVSPIPGTTRDIVEVHLDLGGYPVTLIDTAGLRESDDPVEQEGVRRARSRAAQADLRLIVQAVAIDGEMPPGVDASDIRILNKIDLLASRAIQAELRGAIPVSATTGEGLDVLESRLHERVADLIGTGGHGDAARAEAPPLTQHRHREALDRCAQALARAIEIAGTDPSAAELIAEDVRIASRELGRITGRVSVDDVLDVVFREFCIGK